MRAIKKWFLDLVTEPDNSTHCPARWIALLSAMIGLGLVIYGVAYLKKDFNFQEFSTGVGIMLTTLGAALGIKKDSPPKDSS